MNHCVVMVIAEPPEATPFRGSVKLTAEGAAETVRVWPCALLEPGPTRHRRANTAAHENLLRQKRDMTVPEHKTLDDVLWSIALSDDFVSQRGCCLWTERLIRVRQYTNCYTVYHVRVNR
jgi:hypothetical protein